MAFNIDISRSVYGLVASTSALSVCLYFTKERLHRNLGFWIVWIINLAYYFHEAYFKVTWEAYEHGAGFLLPAVVVGAYFGAFYMLVLDFLPELFRRKIEDRPRRYELVFSFMSLFITFSCVIHSVELTHRIRLDDWVEAWCSASYLIIFMIWVRYSVKTLLQILNQTQTTE